jgi:hypothetical protein
MIWTPTTLDRLEKELVQHHADPAPPIYGLAPGSDTLAPFHSLERWGTRLHPDSGAIDVLVDDDERWEALDAAYTLLDSLDPGRKWVRWEDLGEEEHPGPHVIDEVVSEIDGVRALGPGGRLRGTQRTGGVLVELSVRRRVQELPTTWRPVEAIVASVVEAAADSPQVRIRYGFGYHESSKFEAQRWLRAAFVFLLDQPSVEAGVRWRIAIVQAATDSKDLPPEAGLEGALGHCP